jgi:hypothetical protein
VTDIFLKKAIHYLCKSGDKSVYEQSEVVMSEIYNQERLKCFKVYKIFVDVIWFKIISVSYKNFYRLVAGIILKALTIL